jgi:hypothetical protein
MNRHSFTIYRLDSGANVKIKFFIFVKNILQKSGTAIAK